MRMCPLGVRFCRWQPWLLGAQLWGHSALLGEPQQVPGLKKGTGCSRPRTSSTYLLPTTVHCHSAQKGSLYQCCKNAIMSRNGAPGDCSETGHHLPVTERVAFVQRLWLQVGDARRG